LERGSAGIQTNKQVESCFLNHNSSIQFCCTDSLLKTHRGGLSLSIIIWRIGGGGQVSFYRLINPLLIIFFINVWADFTRQCGLGNKKEKEEY
jgi:hypothetical protein